MNEIQIKAISSSGEPYEVVFTNHGNFFTVFCPCQAGVYGKLCKHKTQLLLGDESMLHNSDDAFVLEEIRSWVKTSDYSNLLKEYSAIKKEIEVANRKEQKFRKILEDAMKKGIQFMENV